MIADILITLYLLIGVGFFLWTWQILSRDKIKKSKFGEKLLRSLFMFEFWGIFTPFLIIDFLKKCIRRVRVSNHKH